MYFFHKYILFNRTRINKNGPSYEEPFYIKPLQCPCERFTTTRMPIPLGLDLYINLYIILYVVLELLY